MSRRIKPQKVKGRQLEEVREKDPDGRIVYHHRTVDTLGKMLRAGTITPEMHEAARQRWGCWRRSAGTPWLASVRGGSRVLLDEGWRRPQLLDASAAALGRSC